MGVVRERSCLDCGRTLRFGRALRCGRCRGHREREADAIRKRESRARGPADPPSRPGPGPVADSRWTDAGGRPISRELVLEWLSDPMNCPPAGSAELRELRQHLEDDTEILDERGDPLADSFYALLAEIPEEAEPEPGPATEPPAFVTRRLEVPVSRIHESDLIAFIQDPTWDAESHREFVAELGRRELAGRIDPSNAGAVRTVLVAFGTSES